MKFKSIAIKFLVIVLVFSIVSAPKPAHAGLPVIDIFQKVYQAIIHLSDKLYQGHDAVNQGGQLVNQTAQTGLQTFDAANKGDNVSGGAVKGSLAAAQKTCDVNYDVGQAAEVTTDDLSNIMSETLSYADAIEAINKQAYEKKLLIDKQACEAVQTAAAAGGTTTDRISGKAGVSEAVAAEKVHQIDQAISQVHQQKKQVQTKLSRKFMFSVLNDLRVSLTDKAMNELKQRGTIGKILGATDQIAYNVYLVDYINDHYSGDIKNKMIVNALARGGIAKTLTGANSQISLASSAAAQMALGCRQTLNNLDFTNPVFYATLANAGKPECSQEYYMAKGSEQAQAALAASQQAAAAEVQAGQGNRSERPCDLTSISKQQQADQDNAKAANELQIAKARLNAAHELGHSDLITKASADLNKADATMQGVGKATNAGNVDKCGPILTSGNFLASTLNKFVESKINGAANLNNQDGYSIYLNLLRKGIVSIVDNLVFNKGSIKTTLMDLGLAAINGASVASGPSGEGVPGTPQFTSEKSPNYPDGYTIRWDADSVPGSNGVSISGPGMGSSGTYTVNVTVGAADVHLTAPATYRLIVLDKNNSPIGQPVTITVTPTSSNSGPPPSSSRQPTLKAQPSVMFAGATDIIWDATGFVDSNNRPATSIQILNIFQGANTDVQPMTNTLSGQFGTGLKGTFILYVYTDSSGVPRATVQIQVGAVAGASVTKLISTRGIQPRGPSR